MVFVAIVTFPFSLSPLSSDDTVSTLIGLHMTDIELNQALVWLAREGEAHGGQRPPPSTPPPLQLQDKCS